MSSREDLSFLQWTCIALAALSMGLYYLRDQGYTLIQATYVEPSERAATLALRGAQVGSPFFRAMWRALDEQGVCTLSECS